ncbi:unnamed protein product [Cochlearia groenlandica]
MNRVIVFVLVIAMYFGLNEAKSCAPNRVILGNYLKRDNEGNDRALQYRCRGSKGEDTGVKFLKSRNEGYKFEFADTKERTTWKCDIRFGKYYFDNLQVYRAASLRRCGQLRMWLFGNQGIYFTRDAKLPAGYVLPWSKSP